MHTKPIYLAEAVLNVKDLTESSGFITRLSVWNFVSNGDRSVWDGRKAVPWFATEKGWRSKGHYGLYHLAFVADTKNAATMCQKHLSGLQFTLVGVQIMDTVRLLASRVWKGNGTDFTVISQFRHRIFREDGHIGVTEALAAQDIYELGKVDPFIPGWRDEWGISNLSVKDSRAAGQFLSRC